MYHKIRKFFGRIVLLIILLGPFSAIAIAGTALKPINPPKAGMWLSDRAGVVRSEDAATIQARCDDVYATAGVPMFVVVIRTMSLYVREGTTIETLARSVYERWGRDPDFAYKDAWRNGMLLLVSLDDRKARIELGADWAGESDEACDQIMQDYIIPAFKRGNYSAGAVAGVNGLAHLAKGDVVTPALRRIGRWIWREIIVTELFMMIVAAAILVKLFPSLTTPRSGGSSGNDDWDSDYSGGSDSGSSDYGGGGGATGSW